MTQNDVTRKTHTNNSKRGKRQRPNEDTRRHGGSCASVSFFIVGIRLFSPAPNARLAHLLLLLAQLLDRLVYLRFADVRRELEVERDKVA